MTKEEIKQIPFNMNWDILVKLTDTGFKHMKKKDDQLFGTQTKHCKPIEYYTGKKDENGFVKMPMWEFMQYFGETIVFGTAPMFSTEILLLPQKA